MNECRREPVRRRAPDKRIQAGGVNCRIHMKVIAMNVLSSTALSGLNSAQTRLAAAANNIANMNTPGFRRDEVSAVPQAGGGVSVSVQKADAEGPDMLRDIVDQKMATYEFKANLQVLKTAREMTGSLLDTIA
jgi:flagellar basal body rod protein FlgC